MIRWFFKRGSLPKACGVSLVLHGCALAVLAGWSLDRAARSPSFGAAQGVVVLEASFVEVEPPPVSSRIAPQNEQVVIRPHRAQVARRHYVETPSHRVPLHEMLTPDALDRLLAQHAEPLPVTSATIQPPETQPPGAEALAMAEARLARTTSSRRPVVTVKASQVRVESAQSASHSGARTAVSFAGNRPPHYPALAKRNGWEGKVLLRLYVSSDGRVRKVEVAQSSGHEVLDGAAVTAVRTWQGTPATVDGHAVETVEILPVRFRLR